MADIDNPIAVASSFFYFAVAHVTPLLARVLVYDMSATVVSIIGGAALGQGDTCCAGSRLGMPSSVAVSRRPALTNVSQHQRHVPLQLCLVLCLCCMCVFVATYWRQFLEDGATIVVGEQWAGRVTMWNGTSGAFLGVLTTLDQPVSTAPCGVGLSMGIVALERDSSLAGQLGESPDSYASGRYFPDSCQEHTPPINGIVCLFCSGNAG